MEWRQGFVRESKASLILGPMAPQGSMATGYRPPLITHGVEDTPKSASARNRQVRLWSHVPTFLSFVMGREDIFEKLDEEFPIQG